YMVIEKPDAAMLATSVEQLTSESSLERLQAANVLGNSGNKEYIKPLLMRFVNESRDVVKSEILSALVKLSERFDLSDAVLKLEERDVRSIKSGANEFLAELVSRDVD